MKEKNKIQNMKKALFFFGINILIILIYLIYIVFIGIPKTSARYYYLEAQKMYSLGNMAEFEVLLNKSKNIYPEAYIVNEYNQKISSD
jgi:hypothetical protein